MVYGGTGSMNVVLKNNKKLLSNREPFKKSYIDLIGSDEIELVFPDSTPTILREIRWRLREEQEKRSKKRYIVFSVIMLVLIYGLVYMNNNFNLLFQ